MDNKRDSQDTSESSVDDLYIKLGDILQALPADRQDRFTEDILNDHETRSDTDRDRPAKKPVTVVE